MMSGMVDFLFISLAANQSRFFLALGRRLEKDGHTAAHVCFHEGAVDEMRREGARVFNPFERRNKGTGAVDYDDFGIKLPALLIGHEKAAYELRDTAELERKFKAHLEAMGEIVDELLAEGRKLVLVQELGGFTSVLAAYFAARRRGVDCWFIEPSFFRGRVFFTPNSFAAPRVEAGDTEVSEEIRAALADIRVTRSVVIPSKDRRHYRSAWRKLADPHNIRRLFEKLKEKYINKRKEEFDHISGHIRRHLKMFVNSQRLSGKYSELPDSGPMLYYPLHVPADFALTIRSPEYLDQLATIDFICRCAPLGWRVVVKEHPALIGALDPARVAELLDRHDNLVLLNPGINNHVVLSRVDGVVTVNSKAGAEALLYNKRVFALGDSFYKDSPLVVRVPTLGELPARLAEARPEIRDEDVERFFQNVWNSSCPGDLYNTSEDNVTAFAASLVGCLEHGARH